VAGAWLLREGEWGLLYRYQRVVHHGTRSGTRGQSLADLRRKGFTELPTDLDLESHTLALLMAPSERLTFSIELPVLRVDMKSRAADGSSFTLRAGGAGDLRLSGVYRFMKKGKENLDLQMTFSIPTGSIRTEDNGPGGQGRLPYPLRLGSGTWDLHPGATYSGQHGDNSWGLQASADFHLDESSLNYHHGDGFQVTGWLARRWPGRLSTSFRVAWSEWTNLRGADRGLDPTVSPTSDPDRQGGARLDLGPGLEFEPPGLGGQRLAVEATWPLYQSLNGPQLERDWELSAAWRWAF
jgi:hypothetical protein